MLANIGRGFGELSASQRVALLLGAVLVAGSLAWMVQWSATPEMTPLWQGTLTPEELASIRSGLDAMNEKYEVRGNAIFVSAGANTRAILAQLQQSNHMPSNLESGFAALVKESNPWISQTENDRRWTVALQRELESVLRLFAGVETARVFLNLNAEQRGFSREAPPSSASVTLVMKGGEAASDALAKKAAQLVAGAVRGLALEKVSVVDASGNSILDWNQEREPATALNRARAEQERVIRDKIRTQLAFDPFALVSVHVELNYSTQVVESQRLEDPVEVSEESTSEQRAAAAAGAPGGPAGGQPGVQPNVGISVGGGSGESGFSKETTRTQKQSGYTRTTRNTPSGETTAIFAAINVSYTYLESIFTRFNPDAGQPTLEQIEKIFEQERKRIVEQISKLVKGGDDRNVTEQIAVSWYYDRRETQAAAPAEAGSPGFGEPLELAQRYGAQAALAGLGLFALFMMFRLSKRTDAVDGLGVELGLPKDAIEAARAAAADVQRVSGLSVPVAAPPSGGGSASSSAASRASRIIKEEAIIPTTSATEGVLVAQEVDESLVQITKMIDEVDEMVSADAEAVAGLFDQWIDQADKVPG